MMTAAMAFFSIALTLNLIGIKVTELRAADFQPSRMRANLTRQFYSTNEQVTKYYENLRLVYEMESRVRELRRTTEAEPAPPPRETPKQPARDGSGIPAPPSPAGSRFPRSDSSPTTRNAIPVRQKLCRPVCPVGKEENSRKRFSGLCRQPLKTKPAFPATKRWTQPRVRLSLRKAA